MAYDEYLADRIRFILKEKNTDFRELKMMGGLCFMVNEKMCVGVMQDKNGRDRLMARVDPEHYEELLSKSESKTMDFTGRSMRGFLFIDGSALDDVKSLNFWIDQCLDFNPRAKASKKNGK